MGLATLIVRRKFATSGIGHDVDTDGTPESLSQPVTTGLDYFATGNDETDYSNADYIKIFRDMLNTNTGGGTYTTSVDDNGYLTIDCDVPFQITWSTHPSFPLYGPADFGWPHSTTVTPATPGLTATSPNPIRGWWQPSVNIHRFAEQGKTKPIGAGAGIPLDASAMWAHNLGSNAKFWSLGWVFVEKKYVKERYATEDGNVYQALEYLKDNFDFSDHCRFRYYENITNRDLEAQKNVTLRLIDASGELWTPEDVARRTTYAVDLRAVESPNNIFAV